LVTEPGTGARPLDQPRDVGDDELAIGAVEGPEDRLERGERVAGDLRLRSRQPGEQRRLAGVRQADEADVREQPQLQLDPALVTGQATLGEPRRLPGRRREA